MTRETSLSDLLPHAIPAFDPRWYAERYADAILGGFSAESHFLAVGHRLGRGTCASQPKLVSEAGLARALSRRQADALDFDRIALSYCIPVMDRLDDLQLTLADNLTANLPHQSRVEFLVVAFEDRPQVLPWLQKNFPEALANGYLRAVTFPALRQWHFGQAKNSFRQYLSGCLYSSLDADNYVTLDETKVVLDLFDAEGPSFLLHHFSGTWGDGSSGRLTMPTWVYHRVGYDERFLPRQFDEVDAILSALVRYPGLTLCHYETGENVLDTDNIRAFLRSVPLMPRTRVLPMPTRHAAANPKPPSYVIDNPAVAAMQSVNEAMCFLKHLVKPDERKRWQQRLAQDAIRLISTTDHRSLAEMVFGPEAIAQLDGLETGMHLYIASSISECQTARLRASKSDAPFVILHVEQLPVAAPDLPDLPDLKTIVPTLGEQSLAEEIWFKIIDLEIFSRGLGPVTWIRSE